ncbi:YcaO-like family protein [Radicibacter daui]|uniref:YcaO-like family protein n=1 Tax=Radicibacter daui TaxID=3064829 RepID=UPI004046C2CE
MNEMGGPQPGPLAQNRLATNEPGPAADFTRRKGLRTLAPEETLARLKPLLAPLGITRVAVVTGLDRVGIPTVMVVRPNSRSLAVAQGKGPTLAAAKASGIMEAIEFYHAETVERPLLHRSAESMLRAGLPIVDIGKLAHNADSTFHEARKIAWVVGQDVADGSDIWVPLERVSMDFTLPLMPGDGAFIANSNGLASGNSREEALAHGLYELVERDALTLWELADEKNQRATRLDPASATDPVAAGLVRQVNEAGLLLGLWDLTSDIGLPVILARLLEPEPPPYHGFRPAFGVGCHPDRDVALVRAVTEAAQSRLTFIAAARDDLSYAAYARQSGPEIYERWLGSIADGGPSRPLISVPSPATGDLAADISMTRARLAACGLGQLITVDLTKPEIGIPVLRVIVPGLEDKMDTPLYVPGERALAQFGRFQPEEA